MGLTRNITVVCDECGRKAPEYGSTDALAYGWVILTPEHALNLYGGGMGHNVIDCMAQIVLCSSCWPKHSIFSLKERNEKT